MSFQLRAVGFGFALLLATLVGCDSGPTLNKVSGTLKYKGQPVPNIALNFIPTSGRPGQAVTDEMGRFGEVMYDADHSGLTTGDYEVILTWIPTGEPATPGDPPPTPPADLHPLLQRYGNFQKPEIQVTITDGQRTLDLDLQ